MSHHRGSRKPGFPKNCCAHAPDSVDPRHDSISAIRRGRCTNAYEKAGAKFCTHRLGCATHCLRSSPVSKALAAAALAQLRRTRITCMGKRECNGLNPFYFPEIPPVDT